MAGGKGRKWLGPHPAGLVDGALPLRCAGVAGGMFQ